VSKSHLGGQGVFCFGGSFLMKKRDRATQFIPLEKSFSYNILVK
jgi:hypothetical protein